MKTYLAKITYRIICGNGNHTPQFDVQLRLIYADDDFHAFQKARLLGEREEDSFFNSKMKPVLWKFLDVTEIHPLTELADGVELYSQIREEEDALLYEKEVRKRALHLYETCLNKNILMN